MGCSFERKKSVSIVNAFRSILKDLTELHCSQKPNKIWVDKGSGFCNNSFKKWLSECNNTYRTIKMKPIDVKDNTYINISKEVNDKDPKFKVGDHVKISKYKNIFCERLYSNLV